MGLLLPAHFHLLDKLWRVWGVGGLLGLKAGCTDASIKKGSLLITCAN